MKKLFFAGFFGLMIFEIMNVYLIMPMPGSQEMNSIDTAYFLYRWRWMFRILFGAMLFIGFMYANWKKKWVPWPPLIILVAVVYTIDFQVSADHTFYQPKKVLMANADSNKVDTNRLVIGIINKGEAKAYPIHLLAYHHQVKDSIGGKPVIVTYCNVCRTGRVFEPVVDAKPAQFRLVGMDHFNAMFEDDATKSWWRQATGEAITGKSKGEHLLELFSTQTSLGGWLRLYPNSLVMQPDPAFTDSYDTTLKYESGKSKSKLTGTDSLSWKDKSWVIGVKAGKEAKAYDWNKLKEERIIHDKLGNIFVLLVLAKDDKAFFAFERPAENAKFSLNNDTLMLNNHRYKINGQGIDTVGTLKPLPAYQEFWHSWRTFNPGTKKY
ncbi:MAG: DUF3179 domain-containing (seleno)protein [Ferruginibacter sp.]